MASFQSVVADIYSNGSCKQKGVSAQLGEGELLLEDRPTGSLKIAEADEIRIGQRRFRVKELREYHAANGPLPAHRDVGIEEV